MPWILGKAEELVTKHDNMAAYAPKFALHSFLDQAAITHQQKVAEHKSKLETAKKEAEENEKNRISNKLKRKQEKEAAHKAEEIRKLKEQIQADYIAKATVTENITSQEIVDCDGFGLDSKPQLMVLGGFLGQLMIVLNTITKHYSKMDIIMPASPSASAAALEEVKSVAASVAAASNAEEGEAEVPYTPKRKILDPSHVQTFLYNYILGKMKMDRLSIQVEDAYRVFLSKLAAPMQVNEMRTMKEPNYSELRKMLTNNKGGEVLRLMHKFADELSFDPYIFDLVFEGFWDVYLFRGQIAEGASGKKMLAWIPKVNLKVNETTVKDEKEEVAAVADEEGQEKPEGEAPKVTDETVGEPITAIVRVKLGKKQPEPEEDDDGNLVEKDIPEEDLEDLPIEDKAWQMVSRQNGQKLYVLNQAAGRTYRAELATEFHASCDNFATVNLDEFMEKMEVEAERFENAFCDLFKDCEDNQSGCQKVPIFDFRPVIN